MANPVKLKARVSMVESHGEGVYELRLRPLGRVPRFKSGQFLHLAVDDYDPAGGFWPESRVFSIASSSCSEEIVIVYSVKGAFTRKMESSLSAGKEIWLKLPYGEFHIDPRAGRDIILVAGGTGVSPFLPFIGEIAELGTMDSAVRLYYGARKVEQLLFLEKIASCAAAQPKFAYTLFVEDEAQAAGLGACPGRLAIDEIRKEALIMDNPLYFLSGPPAMINAFKDRLVELGTDANDVRNDEWE